MNKGHEYTKEDLDYVQYALEESLRILDESLSVLQENAADHDQKIQLAQMFLRRLKGEILNI